MKTIQPKQITSLDRKWYCIDAKGKTLGRIATLIARLISGKDKIDYAHHVDNGDYVIVLNADKVVVTGNKEHDKLYRTHSQFMGGLHETSFEEMRDRHPTKMMELAVAGMLPKNKLRDAMLLRLRLETGDSHGYAAQKPIVITE